MKKILSIVLFLLMALNVFCLEDDATGLETGGDLGIYVIVADLNEDAKQLGLREQIISSKVELRLRQNGIIPIDTWSFERNFFLYIHIMVVGEAFSFEINIQRWVYYFIKNKEYSIFATTWKKGITGTHSNNESFILNKLLDGIDMFCNEFLKVNAPLSKKE